MQLKKRQTICPTSVQSVHIKGKRGVLADVVLVRPKGGKPRERVDIEHLVMWAAGEYVAGYDGFDQVQDMRSLWDTVERLSVLGTMVDRSFSVTSAGKSHPDADLVIDTMRELLTLDERQLVFGYCSAGLQPDWEPDGVGEFEPVLNGKGEPKMVWGNRNQRRDPIACMVMQVGATWHHVVFARQQYADWHRALVKLVNVLWGRLDSRCPTGPLSPARPWL